MLIIIFFFVGVASENLRVSKYNDMIRVSIPAKVANKMFQTEFSTFRSLFQRNVVLSRITKPYYLPAEVAEVVSIVDDIMRFPSVRRTNRILGSEESTTASPFNSCGSKCNGFTTPEVLAQAYSFSPVTTVAPGNSMSVAEFQYQYCKLFVLFGNLYYLLILVCIYIDDNTDLKSFSNACGVTATVDKAVGGNNEKICEAGGCVEALLDIEYIEAVANPIPLTVIYLASCK